MAIENDGIHILKDDSGLNAMAMMNNYSGRTTPTATGASANG